MIMFNLFSLIFALSVSLVASAATEDYNVCNKTAPAGFIGLKTDMISANAQEHQVSGTLTVIDACSFRISNFTFFPAEINSYFYGTSSPTAKPTASQRLVSAAIGAYVLYPSAGPFLIDKVRHWGDANVIMLYSEMTQNILGYAKLELPNQSQGTANTKSTPGSDKNQAAVVSAHGLWIVCLQLLLTFFAVWMFEMFFLFWIKFCLFR